ncbi:unnamed protein product [Enterobius vermicularis]|uniref:Ovule protein n=1 Tax=Enterobius vermicularis TaxID=51028 RepID=A0A0N4V0W6_ENTVE|nr:unnamed protein product [Enterobius vermicularis]
MLEDTVQALSLESSSTVNTEANVSHVEFCDGPGSSWTSTSHSSFTKNPDALRLSKTVEPTRRVTVVDKPGQEKVHFTAKKRRFRNKDSPKQSV